jgi:energy-coupling factor transporter ATP-binding protein EcfA2
MERRGIEAIDLERAFDGGIGAVDGISLAVASGGIYGFLWPNGAGRSTTVDLLTTLLRPTGGRAIVGGMDVATRGAGVRGIIGAALQEVALDPHLTGDEHGRRATKRADRRLRGSPPSYALPSGSRPSSSWARRSGSVPTAQPGTSSGSSRSRSRSGSPS